MNTKVDTPAPAAPAPGTNPTPAATDTGNAPAPGTTPEAQATPEPQDPILDGLTLAELHRYLPEEADALKSEAEAAVADAPEQPAPAAPEAPSAAATPAEPTPPEPVAEAAAPPQNDLWTEVQATIPAPDMSKIQTDKAAAVAKREDLDRKFAAGDIEQADYMRDMQAVMNDIARLDMIPETHRMAQQAQQDAVQNRWTETVKRYEEANPELVSAAHVRGWDAELRAVTSTYPTLNFQQAIRLAHQRYEQTASLLGEGLKINKAGENIAAQPAPQTQGQGSAAAPQTKTEIEAKLTDKPEPPKTLRDVPGENAMATAPQIGDALDAVIDGGDSYKSEELFERMSPAQEEAYLRGEI